MKKVINNIYRLFIILGSLLYFVGALSTNVAAVSNYQPPYENGIKSRAGKLQYGFVQSKINEDETPPLNLGAIPDVSYLAGKDENGTDQFVRHLYYYKVAMNEQQKADLGKSYISTALNIIQTDAEYKDSSNWSRGTARSSLVVMSDPFLTAIGTITNPDMPQMVVAKGYPNNDPELLVTIRMYPNANHSAIIHEYEMKNESNKDKTVYPIKVVDTELNDDDRVKTYSRGITTNADGTTTGNGVYIKTLQDPKDPSKGYYRLDYVTQGELEPNQHFPIGYATPSPNTSFTKMFGPDKDNQEQSDFVKQSKTKEVDKELENLVSNKLDTAIGLTWGKVTIPAKSSYIARYDVGISVATSTEKSKTAKNITEAEKRNDGKNQVGDKIKYTIKYKTTKGALSKPHISDVLKDVFDDPKFHPDTKDSPTPTPNYATLTFYDSNGDVKTGYPQKFYFDDPNVYNETTRTFTVPPDNQNNYVIEENETMEVSFEVALSPKSAGTNVTNVANVSSETSESTIVKEEIETTTPLPVSKNGKVTIEYQNVNGETIHSPVTKEDAIGQSYDLSGERLEINGYEFDKVLSGSETGTYSGTDQKVVYLYKAHAFDIKQEVFDKNNVNVDGGSVDMGAKLTYKTTVSSTLKSGTGIKYNNFTVKANVSEYLDNITNIKLTKSDGTTVIKTGTYDALTKTITVTVTAADNVNSDEDLILTYDGVVKQVFDVTLEADSVAGGTYTDKELLGPDVTSNKVSTTRGEGNLELEGPSEINFGNNEISDKEQEYPILNTTGNLTVTDNRYAGKPWSISVTLDKNFTNTTNNDVLYNILKYKEGNTLKNVEFNEATPIISNKVTSASDRGKAINITQDWISKKEGLVLKIPAAMAKKGTYEAGLTWTLYDTPDNK